MIPESETQAKGLFYSGASWARSLAVVHLDEMWEIYDPEVNTYMGPYRTKSEAVGQIRRFRKQERITS